MASLEQLRAEHREHVVGDGIADLLERVVSSTAPTYPAAYADAGVWNPAALEDLLQDWVEKRLLGRGDLTVMLRTAHSLPALRAALTTSLRQFLANRRRRSSASNLFKRTQQMLEAEDDFLVVGAAVRPAEQQWTTKAARAAAPCTRSLRERVQVAFELSDEDLEVVRYGAASLKSSPILRAPALRRFVAHLLDRADGTLSLAEIAEVMRRRFNLVEVESVQLDEALAAPEASPVLAVTVADAAESVISQFDGDALATLAALNGSKTMTEAAERAGWSRARLSSQADRVVALIAESAEDPDEASAIYQAIIESLF